MLEKIKSEAIKATKELIEAAALKKGDIFVVGCSTSEVCGDKIGTNSNYDAAGAVFEGIYSVLCEKGIYLAAQCCEHLNRSVVIEKECLDKYFLDEVNAIPQPKAGGSFATQAYKAFKNPVLVESVSAKAGIDIGGTLIGMHLKKVAVPVRLENNKTGEATVLAARSRPKFIGGCRAIYDEELL